MQNVIDQLTQSRDEFKRAFETQLKEATRLEHEKRMLINMAAASLKKAEHEISRLHEILSTARDRCTLVLTAEQLQEIFPPSVGK